MITVAIVRTVVVVARCQSTRIRRLYINGTIAELDANRLTHLLIELIVLVPVDQRRLAHVGITEQYDLKLFNVLFGYDSE